MTHKRRGFSVSELAEVLGVSNATIYHELNSGQLESIQMGKGHKKHIIMEPHLKKRFGDVIANTIMDGACNSCEPSRSPLINITEPNIKHETPDE